MSRFANLFSIKHSPASTRPSANVARGAYGIRGKPSENERNLLDQLVEVGQKVEQLKAQNISLKVAADCHRQENERLTSELAQASACEAKARKELVTLQESFDQRVTARVIEEIGGAGFEPLNIGGREGAGGPATGGAYAEYRKLAATDPQAAAHFWQQSKPAIIASAPQTARGME